ncbi:MAG: molybdenum cofactor guanylyltransferase [Planctomycetes bacterium]|nr:molybdenum cofactor guanylyltransferase [Planctomycetota bacterium]
MRVGGIVVCGGKSKRMGQPKAWLPLAGELMLPRIVRLLSQAVTPVIVVAAPGQDLPPLPPECVVVRDEKDDQGPLEGLRVGLEELHDRCDAVYLSSCDVPLLVPAFVRRLISLLGEHHICVASDAGHLHPLAAVYRVGVRDCIARLLAAHRRRLIDLFDVFATRVVAGAELTDVDPTLRSLWNINTAADYAQVLNAIGDRT